MNDVPYSEIPDYPGSYDAGPVLGRMVDAVGFRYHWATDGLTDTDLDYRPSEKAKSARETLGHIRFLMMLVENTFSGATYELPEKPVEASFEEMRADTLGTVKRISERLKSTSAEDFEKMFSRFKLEGKDLEFPFWNVMNGPIADALCHIGQLVTFRRTSGNPIDPAVQAFLGKKV